MSLLQHGFGFSYYITGLDVAIKLLFSLQQYGSIYSPRCYVA